jgi:hypothetical protein
LSSAHTFEPFRRFILGSCEITIQWNSKSLGENFEIIFWKRNPRRRERRLTGISFGWSFGFPP